MKLVNVLKFIYHVWWSSIARIVFYILEHFHSALLYFISCSLPNSLLILFTSLNTASTSRFYRSLDLLYCLLLYPYNLFVFRCYLSFDMEKFIVFYASCRAVFAAPFAQLMLGMMSSRLFPAYVLFSHTSALFSSFMFYVKIVMVVFTISAKL